MFTDELWNIILVEPNRYYQQHVQGQNDKTPQPGISIDELLSFSSSDNPEWT
jgi:hypothetical protein